MEKSMIKTVAKFLVIIGAINWGLVGLGNLMGSDMNIVHMLLGGMDMLEDIVYVLVGLSGIYGLIRK
ncbi:MAG: DUF378 domain-containing protein [bacterium]|nr:DUF378 domain-containing protein [bacterium]